MVERKKKISRNEFLQTGGEFTAGQLEEIALMTDGNKKLLLVSENAFVLAELNEKYSNLVMRRLLIPLVLANGFCKCPEIDEEKLIIPKLENVRFVNSVAYFRWVRDVSPNTKKKLPVLRLAQKGEELSPENMSVFKF